MSRTSRILFLMMAAFFSFMASYLFMHTKPFYKSLSGEEDLFYGKISSVAFPRGWTGTGIPLFDKTFICLNEDRGATFVLALPGEQKKILAEWIPFWAEIGPAAIELRGVRISQSEWIVTGLEGNDLALDPKEIHEYHVRSVLWYAVLNIGLVFLAIQALRIALRRKK